LTVASAADIAPPQVAIESGSAVEWTEEENYKFRLSEFREKLIDWLQADERGVLPHASE
jgi:methionyl-tRNA synthetase